LTLPEGGSLELNIPPGVRDGQVLRLHGKGAPSPGEGEAGDAFVEISINPHRFFTRQGDDIYLDLPITLKEAVLGGQVKVPTPTGSVILTVPRGSNTGVVLRLKGRGVQRPSGRGDEFAKLKVMLPSEPNPELDAFLAGWRGSDYDPRRDLQP
jgi:DnaJ-class molecular chaperone